MTKITLEASYWLTLPMLDSVGYGDMGLAREVARMDKISIPDFVLYVKTPPSKIKEGFEDELYVGEFLSFADVSGMVKHPNNFTFIYPDRWAKRYVQVLVEYNASIKKLETTVLNADKPTDFDVDWMKNLMYAYYFVQMKALTKKTEIKEIAQALDAGARKSGESSFTHRPNVIRLDDGVVCQYSRKTNRKNKRHIEAWGVRGHIRRYKSGKEVFIAPFTKGAGKLTNKIYSIGN